MVKSRRDFLKKAAFTGTALAAAPSLAKAGRASGKKKIQDASAPFKLKYAPTLSIFSEHAGKDPVDNVKFCYDMGFRAIFDAGFMARPVEEQEKIAGEMRRLGLEMGPIHGISSKLPPVSFALKNPEVREMLAIKLREAVELKKRTGVKWGTITLGDVDTKLHMNFQTANVIDNLRFCCDIIEPEGFILVMEPLNTLINHPGKFLTGIPQAFMICRSVNRPVCKIVEDFYHQQITEGNLIPNMEAAWSEIAAFHIGDTPGRKEPTTGEINYRNVFRYICQKKYDGVLCMEHGKSGTGKEGEVRLIQAYRESDSFEI